MQPISVSYGRLHEPSKRVQIKFIFREDIIRTLRNKNYVNIVVRLEWCSCMAFNATLDEIVDTLGTCIVTMSLFLLNFKYLSRKHVPIHDSGSHS